MTTKNRLPDKPSELLKVAIADLEAVENDPDYLVDMSIWHKGMDDKTESENQCVVCLAGSVMARTLNVDKKVNLCPEELGETISSQLLALELFRQGNLKPAFERLKCRLPRQIPSYITVSEYRDDPDSFKCTMKGLVVLLKQHNL